jgi:hypothetical protein
MNNEKNASKQSLVRREENKSIKPGTQMTLGSERKLIEDDFLSPIHSRTKYMGFRTTFFL